MICVNFCKFTTELWPLAIVEVLFPLNIFVNKLMEFDSRVWGLGGGWGGVGVDIISMCSLLTFLVLIVSRP